MYLFYQLEGTSRTLLEAMSMKRLIIGSNKPGIKSLIKNDNVLFLKNIIINLYTTVLLIFFLLVNMKSIN